MKEPGRGTALNTHNLTSLIRTLKHVSDILQTEKAFTVEEYTHTDTPALIGLNYYVSIVPTSLRANLYMFFKFMLNCSVPTCVHFSRTYVPTTTQDLGTDKYPADAKSDEN